MNALYLELNRWMRTSFCWEDDNCAFVASDWVVRVRGVDPSANDRLTFDDMGSCQKATKFFTDPVGVIDDRLKAVGVERGTELKAGDVGVVQVPDEKYPVVGIWTGASWAFKAPKGVTSRAPHVCNVLAFWSVGYEA